jgi:hypothetical protein
VRELNEMLRPRVRVRARVDQDCRSAPRGDHHSDRRPLDPRQAADVQQRGGEHGAGVSGRDGGVRVSVGHGANGPYEGGVGLRSHRLGRLLVHLDRRCRDYVFEPGCLKLGRAEQQRLNRR